MIQFLFGVVVGIAIVLFVAYILVVDPWAPPTDQPQPPIDQFRPVQVPEELRGFLKSGEDGQGISRWESCNSISLLLHMLFQEHKDTRALRRWVHKRLQMELNDITTRSAAGRLIQEIRIRELSLGTKFMTINSIRVENVEMAEDKSTFEKVVFILDIDYSGAFETSIDVSTIIAKKASLSVKITKLTGLVRVILSRQPYHHWTFSFVSQPIFETEINSQIQGHQLKRLIPIIKEAIRRSLQRKHVWPNYKIRYRPFFPNPIFQASPPIHSFSHIKLEGGIEVTVLQCSRLKSLLLDDKNKNYEVYCTVTLDHRPLVQSEEQGHCVSVLLTFSRYDLTTPIGLVFDKYASIPTNATNQTRPVKVESVEDNSLADKAAFKAGDVLVAINNVPIRSERQVTRFLQQTTGELMVLVERSLDDIDDEELKEGEIVVSDVRDAEGFEILGEIRSKKVEDSTTDSTSIISNRSVLEEDEKVETARRRHSVSNFESSIVDTNTESVASSVFSLDANRFEKPAAVSVQRAESARVPQLLVSQPSFDIRRTQSESRLDAKVIDAILSSSADFGAENSVEDEIQKMLVGDLNRSASRNEFLQSQPEDKETIKKIDKDRTLTQADAIQGLSMMVASNTGSVASLTSVNSNRTDTEGEGNYVEDEESLLNRKRAASTRKAKIQATFAAGKKKMFELMPQKKKYSESQNDFGNESIEIGADAGSLFEDREVSRSPNPSVTKRSPTDEKKEKKKLKKKLSDSPKDRRSTQKSESPSVGAYAKSRTTKSVQFQRDVLWGQSVHFELDPTTRVQLRYLNVTVHAKEVRSANVPSTPDSLNSSDPATPSTSSGSGMKPADPVLLGTVSLYIPQLIDDCRLTLSNCHREVFQLKQPMSSTPPVAPKDDPLLTEFARHAGFDPRLCFGDLTLGFRYFPNGLPTGTALNSGDESDEEMVRLSSGLNQESTPGRPFSPPALSPANHDWKLWYGKNSATCAMCRGKIWLRNASCCGRCLVICHNKCVIKANQGGIACSPHQINQNDQHFEDLTTSISSESAAIEEPGSEMIEPLDELNRHHQLLMQSPSVISSPDTAETSKRARFKKVTDKFSNWRKGGKKKEDDLRKDPFESDRLSQQSITSSTSNTWSTDSSSRPDIDGESPMASIQDVLADLLPSLDGSPFMHGLYFQPGNAYNEQTIRNAKLLGREIFSELMPDERFEKINSQIDRIQAAIRETKDERLNVIQNQGESSEKFQLLDERLQALAVLMLHYCSALQDCQSGRSTPSPPTVQPTTPEDGDRESVLDEDTVIADAPSPIMNAEVPDSSRSTPPPTVEMVS